MCGLQIGWSCQLNTCYIIAQLWSVIMIGNWYFSSQDPEIHSLVSSNECGLEIGGLCEETLGRYWVIIVMCPAVVCSLEGINYQHLSQVAACHPGPGLSGHPYL